MSSDRRNYLSYLLRLWQEPLARPDTWRASLENTHTGELLGFATVGQLFAFLEQQVGGDTDATRSTDAAPIDRPANQ